MQIIKSFLIIGYRRWARLLAEELCANVKDNSSVCLIGNPHSNKIKKWLNLSGLSSRVKILKEIKPLSTKEIGIAFVVNSAYLHEFTTKNLLKHGYNVVCEKPISFSRNGTVKLIKFAAKKKLQLFCTNTYSFATYLKKLKDVYLKKKSFSDIYITWSDPKKEIRYKQIKSYDSGVPIIYDILPHVANILYATIGNFKLKFNSLNVKKGGSKVSIYYQNKKMNIFINLERNAIRRKRFIKFISPKNKYFFDFKNEPGLISINNQVKFKIDNKWSARPNPISIMINSVISFFELRKKDTRLSLTTSLLGNEMIDIVAKDYVHNQIQFINNHNKNLVKYNRQSITYALKECSSIKKRSMIYLRKKNPLYELILNTACK
jgi:hypothetical protein